jgi:hypothetical protein
LGETLRGSDLGRLLHCTTALSLILIVMVLTSVRRAHIRVEYSVSWLLASVALLGLSLNPRILSMAAGLFGIDYAPVALLLIAGAVFLLVFFRLSVIISKLKDDNIALAQRLAIVEFYLRNGREQA